MNFEYALLLTVFIVPFVIPLITAAYVQVKKLGMKKPEKKVTPS